MRGDKHTMDKFVRVCTYFSTVIYFCTAIYLLVYLIYFVFPSANFSTSPAHARIYTIVWVFYPETDIIVERFYANLFLLIFFLSLCAWHLNIMRRNKINFLRE